MYIEEQEKTGLQKIILSLNVACAAIFSVSGKVLKAIVRFLAGEPNQNGRNSREVNS